MKRHLVTGGAGFIGSHLVEALVGAGEDVVVVDDLSTGSRENLAGVKGRCELIRGDVCDPALMEKACAGVDTVFHLAALTSVPESVETPLAFLRVDVEGTLMTLMKAREAGVRRFLFAGSSAVYGEGSADPAVEEETLRPQSPYAAAKAAAEAYCQAFRSAYRLEAVVLRFFNVFGPRQRADSPFAAVVPRFLTALLEEDRPTVFGDGMQTRDLIYVGDVVEALLAVAKADPPLSAIYNVGSGRAIQVLEILREACAALGRDVAYDVGPHRPGDILHSLGSVEKLKKEVGFEPTTPLSEGMRRTAGWLRERADAGKG
ncbi:MAG: NAD-dependent epimerase/dehydratase family protein [Planctomycetota bacterium]|jgi:UDP-glucose 4-epimerase